jgi:hypothetical protein
MKFFKVGESQKAACEICKSFQNSTFRIRDVALSDGGIVQNILVGVCDECDNVNILPHQSTQLIKSHLDIQRKPLES